MCSPLLCHIKALYQITMKINQSTEIFKKNSFHQLTKKLQNQKYQNISFNILETESQDQEN